MIETLRTLPFLVVLPVSACAQTTDTTSLRHRYTVEGIGGFDGNGMRNDIVMPMLFGGELGRDARQSALDGIGAMGRGGIELGARATATWGNHLFGSQNWQARTSVAWQYAVGARFSHDAFAVAFFGNAAYEDQTAHLGPLRFDQWHYQTLGFGIENARTGAYVELAVVNGTGSNSADVERADLFTAPYGRYLDLDLAGSYHRSDTAAGAGFSKGLGAAINAKWVKTGKIAGAPAAYAFQVTDAGFLAWNASSLSARTDSMIHFEGVRITDVFDLNGPLVDRTRLQDSLGLGFERGGYIRPLPARALATVRWGERRKPGHGADRYAYALSVDQRWIPGYIPRGRASRFLSLGRSFTLNVGAGYGGFGGWRALAGLEFANAHGITCSLTTSNVLGTALGGMVGKDLEFRIQAYW